VGRTPLHGYLDAVEGLGPRFTGFGPFLFLLFALAAGVLLPTVTMPQSCLVRCIPQFWRFPLLVGAVIHTLFALPRLD
jgi:hypothetical protein